MLNLKDFSVPLFPRKRLSTRLQLINWCWAPAKRGKFHMNRGNVHLSTCPCLLQPVLQARTSWQHPPITETTTEALMVTASHLSPVPLFAMQQMLPATAERGEHHSCSCLHSSAYFHWINQQSADLHCPIFHSPF